MCVLDSSPPGEEKKTHTQKKRGAGGDCDGFADFWSAYPRREAKVAALKAWNKISPDAEVRAAIHAAITAYKKCDQWTRGVVPHPATWLNNRRWEDDLFDVKSLGSKDDDVFAAAAKTKAETARRMGVPEAEIEMQHG